MYGVANFMIKNNKKAITSAKFNMVTYSGAQLKK